RGRLPGPRVTAPGILHGRERCDSRAVDELLEAMPRRRPGLTAPPPASQHVAKDAAATRQPRPVPLRSVGMARPPRPVALLFLGVQTLILPLIQALGLPIALVRRLFTGIPVISRM